MVRKTFLALSLVLAVAASAQAAIIVTATNPTDVGNGLTAVTLHAHSDNAGQTINGIQDPTIVATGGGSGLHQVWTPITSGHTPTRASQQNAGALWSDTWLPSDSYWLFDNGAGNTLAVGAGFDETNSGVGGAPLASAGLGAPLTGFGALNTQGGAPGNMLFTLASGKPGLDVDFAHLVGKTGESVLATFVVTTAQGVNQTIANQSLTFGAGPIVPEPATLSLICMAMLGCVGSFRRRRAA